MIMTIERSDHIRRRFGIAHLGMLAYGFTTDHGPDPNICFIRAEDEKKEEEKGAEPTGKCGHCGMQNEDDAKFCDQCGKSMAAKKMEGDDDDDKDPPSSKGPPSSERKSEKAGAHPPPPERMSAPRKMSATASTAAILGATADTPLAIKTAAIDMRQERDWLKATLAGITGKDDTAEMIGAALNIPGKIAAGKKAAADLAGLKAKQDDAERWQLADRLVKVAPHMRSKVLADLHDDAGRRITDDKTGRSVRIRSKYAAMDLGVFRGIVSDLEGDQPRKPRNPFEPDKDAAKAASEQALSERGGAHPKLGPGGKPTDAQIKAVTDNLDKHPALAGMWQARGNDPKILPVLAEQYILATAQTGTGSAPKGVYG